MALFELPRPKVIKGRDLSRSLRTAATGEKDDLFRIQTREANTTACYEADELPTTTYGRKPHSYRVPVRYANTTMVYR